VQIKVFCKNHNLSDMSATFSPKTHFRH